MDAEIHMLARARWRVAIILSCAVAALYFGFILAVAFGKTMMGTEIIPGLSVGILAGSLVIIGSWITTWIYVSWANRVFDAKLEAIRAGKGS